MIVYVDASVILRVVMGQRDALKEWREVETGVASELVEVECLRTLDRLRLRGGITEDELAVRRHAVFGILEELEVVELTRSVLTRASQPFPTSLGTLDAIHLATALLWREHTRKDLPLATHDDALGKAARAFGLTVLGLP